jgi:AraC-like DNA-binding protein
MQDTIELSTTFIRTRFADSITLTDIAAAAHMSRFHFSRVFRQATGTSPGRFLSAIRIHEAKRLLLTTQTSIADVSCQVGYTSLGTFTTRFTDCVGVSPGQFRRMAELNALSPIKASIPCPDRSVGSLTGTITEPSGEQCGPIFLGVFNNKIPQGRPEACLMLPTAGEWFLDDVPEGDRYIMAVTVTPPEATLSAKAAFERPMLVAGYGPVRVGAGHLSSIKLSLHPARPSDPPVLLALPTLLRNSPMHAREETVA